MDYANELDTLAGRNLLPILFCPLMPDVVCRMHMGQA